ncbi:hypothetical protein QJS04_geneDACA003743 [Acorus gramineus]|uniref:PB1 domain-containing protein n=1 Tax=Acorus gramineus TaxID=55184 RepID=A0AAV9BKZ8_ACOGR|nr:hypothetical protein QJS04_geneDACA003743 [Acorus gramineus]
MGKPSGKKKKHSSATRPVDEGPKQTKPKLPIPMSFDEDATIFIDMARDLKEEGNKAFQGRDNEAALLKYEKALKLLPKTHVDAPHLRSNIATCYMQMNPPEYHRAVNECNLALEASPKYAKALLKRARCYEALGKLGLAHKDVREVLVLEPNNLTALDIKEKIEEEAEKNGIDLDAEASPPIVAVKEKRRKKRGGRRVSDVVVKEEMAAMRSVKLVFGEDIRWAQFPAGCGVLRMREVVGNKFPGLNAVLVKYKDKEGDLVTITTTEELRWAEDSVEPGGSLRLYIVEVDPERDPLLFEDSRIKNLSIGNGGSENGSVMGSSYVDDWIVRFVRLFKSHLGIDSDAYLDLHELGMKLYAEAIEETVASEDAQELFDVAEERFREMTALALFNWGNIHMSRARKQLYLSEDATRESVLEQVRTAYEWAKKEYLKAEKRYEEAIKIKSDFYEGLFAMGLQQFEQAKLSWYYAIGRNVDLPSEEILDLFNSSEESMERGALMWEEMEEKRLSELSKPDKEKVILEKMGFEGFFKDITTDEAAEQAANMRSQVNLLWGTMLYERSVVEFKLGIPVWEECLMAAVEKFKLAGASPSDIAVMIKNHSSAQEGLGFKIDEIVQAWNEMYDAKRWLSGVPSFRLEPLFRRRVPKLHQILEHA